jgi:hypothetical protein
VLAALQRADEIQDFDFELGTQSSQVDEDLADVVAAAGENGEYDQVSFSWSSDRGMLRGPQDATEGLIG